MGLLHVLLLVVCSSLAAAAPFVAPPPTGHVTDGADVLSSEAERRINDALDKLHDEKGIELAVLTVAGLDGLTVEEYGVKVFEAWRLGKRGEDRGLLLLVAPGERAVRIEVGYGLEGDLTDAHTGRIIRNVMVPEFKEGRFGAGTVAGVEALIAHFHGVTVAETPARNGGDALSGGGVEAVADRVLDLLGSAIAVLLMLGSAALLFLLMAGGRVTALSAGAVDVALLVGLGRAVLGGNAQWSSLLWMVLLSMALLGAVVVRLGGRRGRGLLGRIRSQCAEIVAATSTGGSRSSRSNRRTESETKQVSSASSTRSSSDSKPSRSVGGGGRSGGGGASGHW